jgi:hypothetical protein
VRQTGPDSKNCIRCGTLFTRKTILCRGNFNRQMYCNLACQHADRPYTVERLWKVFWSRVDKNGPGGCWLWTGTFHETGYGIISFRGRKNFRAHRLLYEHLHGKLDRYTFCLHKCDVRACVNPDHIFLGSYAENAADCKAKGRTTRGERSAAAKITEKQAVEILSQKPTKRVWGYTTKLAKKHGISVNAVQAIWAGRAWRYLQPDLSTSTTA